MAKQNLYAIIDLETTGGDPRRDRITEVAIQLYDGKQVIDTFQSLLNPEVAIPYEITRITGIDNDMVKDAPRFYEVAKSIVEITEGAIFVAHNARFDYGFLQHAFRRLGYSYSRKQLCTIKLARKVYPGLKSYSLGALCKHFSIENKTAHRAWSDTAATLELFQIMTREETEEEDVSLMLKSEIATHKLPPRLAPAKVDALPDAIGVYYFFDGQGNILYIGKSTGIRKRVLSHFSSAHRSVRTMRMLNQIEEIDFTLTGSELLALLLENEEIKRHWPPYNRAQRRRGFKFGIFTEFDGKGYQRLEVRKLEKDTEPIAPFPMKSSAEGALRRKVEEFELCPSLSGLANCRGHCFYRQIGRCHGAGIGDEEIETYNERVAEAVQHLIYGNSDFLVVGAGREEGERSVVVVRQGKYRGYGYFDPAFTSDDPEEIMQAAVLKDESPDVRQIIQAYIRKNPSELIRLDEG